VAVERVAHATEPTLIPTTLTQLRQDLAVVMSAEAFFTLIDLCELSSADAFVSVSSTARRSLSHVSPEKPSGTTR
jgi:spore maturation protein SpmA